MSWSDDMRCLHCDGKLPLYRKITNGQFCSTAHRKAYWQEQERLAVERLHQTHSTLKALKPVAPVESILGPEVQPKSELGGFAPAPVIYPLAQGAPRMLAADPLMYDMELAPGKPVWNVAGEAVRSIPGAGFVHLLQVWFSAERTAPSAVRARGGDLNPRAVTLRPVQSIEAPQALFFISNGPLIESVPVESVLVEAVQEEQAAPEPVDPPMAVRLSLPLSIPEFKIAGPGPREALASRMPRPTRVLRLDLVPVTPELKPAPRPEAPSFADQMLPLASIQVRPAEPLPPQAAVVAVDALEVALPVAGSPEHRVAWNLSLSRIAGVAPMCKLIAAPAAAALAGVSAPLSGAAPLPGYPELKLVLREPKLAMGRGRRYPVEYSKQVPVAVPSSALEFPRIPADVRLPVAQTAPLLDPHDLLDTVIPALAGMARLKFKAGSARNMPAKPLLLEIATIPQPLRTEHIIPATRLEPIDAPLAPELDGFTAPSSLPGLPSSAPKVHLWTRAAGFWKVAPRDLKLLTCCIPVLLALAFHRQLPKVHVAGPNVSAVELRDSLHNVVNTQLSSVRQAVMDRAGVALDDDFRSGLDDWASRGDATAAWSFDATGFVRPGPLALYRPSMGLGDYELQFLGMIDKKAMSWVVRAADFDNYYVVKLEVLKAGPMTTLGVTRYAVIDGKPENRVDTPVRIDAQPDTLYRVAMDLDGENFSLLIQGQMVDSWSEPRLTRGGVGFFTSPNGEDSRIRWVAVRHQYDMLGRLCAYLAPYESPTTNGSW